MIISVCIIVSGCSEFFYNGSVVSPPLTSVKHTQRTQFILLCLAPTVFLLLSYPHLVLISKSKIIMLYF